MKTWVIAIGVVLLATFSASAQYRYMMSGTSLMPTCGILRVNLQGKEWVFEQATMPAYASFNEMVSFPTELNGNSVVSWYKNGPVPCCEQTPANCGGADSPRLIAGPNCWSVFINYNGWQVSLYFTRILNPAVTEEQCDYVQVAIPEEHCNGSGVSQYWYVSDNPASTSPRQLHPISSKTLKITPALVAATGLDPYGPLFVCYRYKGVDWRFPTDGPYSDYSAYIPIGMYHAAPTVTLTPTDQLCTSASGVTLTNTVAVLPQVRLSIRKEVTEGVWQKVLPDTEYNSNTLENRFFALPPGKYEMAMRNWGGANSADACPATFAFEVKGRYPAVDILANVVDEKCFGAAGTGSITLTPGGVDITPPYHYDWSHDNALHSKDLTGLAGDVTYHVTVTDNNGCLGEKDITVAEPDAMLVTEAYVSSDHNGSDVSCPANAIGTKNDGAIHLAGGGGTGQLSYQLTGNAYTTAYQTSGDFATLPADVYRIFVKDSQGCEVEHTASVQVTAPKDIRHSCMAVVPLRCNGIAEGSITVVNARGGTGILMYGIAGANYQASNVIGNRNSQTYTVSIRDGNGCRRDTAVVVGQPAAIAFDPIVLVPQSCTAVVDGELTASAHGGTGDLEYALTDDDDAYSALGVFTSLPSGSYTVYARDANRCVVPSTTQLVGVKAAINAAISIRDSISCHGKQDGALRITIANGGTAPYNIAWADQRGSSDVITGLGAATYSVTVTDAKTCQQTWTFPLREPEVLTAWPEVSDYKGFGIHCAGGADGTIDLQLQGGTRPYRYTWTDGPEHEDRTALPTGTYAVSVRDYHGCTTSATDIVVTEPPPLRLRLADQKNISCFGFENGRVTLEALGGVGGYQYSRTINTWQPDSFFVNLPVGDYALSVRDGNNCQADVVHASLTQPVALELELLNKTETTCGEANGMLEIKLEGGVGNYTYAWHDEDNQVVSVTTKAQALASGDYHFVGTDGNTCTIEMDYAINDSDGPKVFNPLLQRLTCHGSNDGSISVEVGEGQAPYTITWDIKDEHGLSVANVTGGAHWIEVRDGRGCRHKESFVVESPEAIQITPSITLPHCHGGSDGSIEVSVAGGNPGGYTYTWTAASDTGPRREGLPAGRYVLRVQDTKACSLEQTIVLDEPAVYTVDAGGDRTICVGQQLSLSAPNDAMFCQWTSDAGYANTAHQVVLTVPARYTLQVTNADGCMAEDHFNIATSNDVLTADFLMAAEAVAGDTVVLIDISWPVPDNIDWNFPDGTQIVSTDDIYAAIVFPEAGEYDIVLDTHLGECLDNLAKRITIKGSTTAANGRVEPSCLTQFDIYPNPNEGAFAVRIAFAETATGQWSLNDLSGGRTLVRQPFAGQASYEFHPTVLHNLPSGIYVLVLESAGARYYKRMVKK